MKNIIQPGVLKARPMPPKTFYDEVCAQIRDEKMAKLFKQIPVSKPAQGTYIMGEKYADQFAKLLDKFV